ncbi:RDD family protein [Terricaulis silvestris]|uniref:RDD family protein n=1 Tax=Terricaulis silvestris TaxID=2686094 RepID=A0A6I6MIB4_9CAUL|nr:RDD family protein [Terricaulis silvestris]QGZ94800.1 RDD family protein [Terricaulis silvestris]
MTVTADPEVRPLVTPEGVDLRVRIAPVSERGAALLIDLAIIVAALIAATLVVAGFGMATGMQGASGQLAAIIWLLGFFLLRNFYFTAFECGARGATPGKRILGLRVAARSGGALRVDQVVARNAMRELELYLPIGFLFANGSDVEALIILCGIVWCAIFVFLPLFNRDRLRLGDIIAGTWVIKAPKQVLLPDMASARAGDPAFVFTDAQLDQYGVKELQVLESVLRNADPTAMTAVAERIRTKISWRKTGRELDSEFLSAYYAALRRRLEQRLLFGKRKRDKHDLS